MDVLDITAPDIQAKLLRLESQRLERKLDNPGCIRLAYDAIAESLSASGVDLSGHRLKEIIPAAVLEGALKFGWASDPGKREVERKERRVRYVTEDTWFKRSSNEPVSQTYIIREVLDIPEVELTKTLGSKKVTEQYYVRWLNLLAGRILYWEAKALDAPKAVDDSQTIDRRASRVGKSEKPSEAVRQARAAARRAVVQPLLDAKKPKTWSLNFWANKAGLANPHAAYRYMNGENIIREHRIKLARALGADLPK